MLTDEACKSNRSKIPHFQSCGSSVANSLCFTLPHHSLGTASVRSLCGHRQTATVLSRVCDRITMAFVSSIAPAVLSPASSPATAVCERQSAMRGVPVQRSARAPVRTTATRQTTSMVLGKSFTESLALSGNFKEFLALAKFVGLDLDATPGTLFAPDDRAFGRLKPGTLEAWYKKPAVAKAILEHHLLPGKVLTLAKIKGCGFWEGTMGGPLAYEGMLRR